jgi:hypothetical protein
MILNHHAVRLLCDKLVQALGAYKLARFAYDRLQQHRVPPSWQDAVDLDMLAIQVITTTTISITIITAAAAAVGYYSSACSQQLCILANKCLQLLHTLAAKADMLI